MSDGADLTNKQGGKYTSAGIKVTDLGAMDPDRTGEYLFIEHDKDGTVIYKNAHSLKHMQLCETVAAGEKKELINTVFFPFYRQIKRLTSEGIPASDGWPDIKPLNVKVCADQKTTRLLVGYGGAFKSASYACHCCEAKKDEDLFAIRRGDMVCQRYCKKYGRSICRHRPMNLKHVVATRTEWLYSTIIDDGKRRNGETYDWREELPDTATEIVIDYGDDGKPITSNVNLRRAFDDNGNPTQELKHYLRHMRHSEESDIVIKGTIFCNNPEDGMQFTDPRHLSCKLDDQDEDTIADFHDNISDSLELRGYKYNEMCQMSNEELKNLLSQCLHQ